jgi:hypothetical protein
VAAPPLLLAAITAVLLVLGLFDRNPFWPRHTITIAEAAALRDRATVAQLAESGTDLSVPYRVRPGLLDNDAELWLTAPEAAILANRAEILAVLFNAGLTADDTTVRGWTCLARTKGRNEALAYLAARFDALADTPCGP